jgi:hypothetical protein
MCASVCADDEKGKFNNKKGKGKSFSFLHILL